MHAPTSNRLNTPADTRPQVRYWIPEGYVTEEGLRSDVRALARRGFGAIELVAVNFFNTPMPDDCRWGTPHYYAAVRTVLDEARAQGLAVDIANGPGWPISVPHIADADNPATLYELTYGANEIEFAPTNAENASAAGDKPIHLPARRVTHDEGTPRLVAACAYKLAGDKLLDEHSYVDLLPFVRGDALDWRPTPAISERWAIFAFWGQPACHKVLNRHFVVDHLSREGAEASISWWRDELIPALQDEASHLRSFFCDSLEYRVAMEWTRDFAQAFHARHGYSILPYLPVVGEPGTYPKNDVAGYAFADAELTRAVRRDYVETLSWMFATRHLRTLCNAAASLGKTVRYQVAYNKPFCEEDAAAAVDLPENESLGRQTLDNLRAMSGAAHLARKPRYSFEAAAEFGRGYGQTQRDMLWWLKRAAIAGCNAQVFHGAAYCGHGMAGVAWPGWEAWDRLCSNSWGRTLSERSFAQLTDAIARINALRRERALPDVAFVREAYLNDGHGADGNHVVADDGLLCARGYSYDLLSPALLSHENAQVRDARLDPDGAAYKALVLAGQPAVTKGTLERLVELAQAGLPVFVVGRDQLAPYSMADLSDRAAWQRACDALLSRQKVMLVESYADLLAAFEASGIAPDARYEAPHVFSAHVRHGDKNIYLLYNGNRVRTRQDGKADPATFMPNAADSGALEPCDLHVSLAGTGHPYLLDLASGRTYALPSERHGDRVELRTPLEPDQLVAIGLQPEPVDSPAWTCADMSSRTLDGWSLTLYELQESADPLDFVAGGYRERTHVASLANLTWWNELPESLGIPADFAGFGEYRTTVELDALPEHAFLQLPAWSDALELDVNGQALPVVAGLGSVVDVRDALRPGTNELHVRVFSNLSNKLDAAGREQFRLPPERYGMRGDVRLLTA